MHYQYFVQRARTYEVFPSPTKQVAYLLGQLQHEKVKEPSPTNLRALKIASSAKFDKLALAR